MGNASASNAAQAGALVETLAHRALVLCGVDVSSIPRAIGVPGTPGDRKPIQGLTYERGMDPSENAAALLVSFFFISVRIGNGTDVMSYYRLNFARS
jgi:hypothetical protein